MKNLIKKILKEDFDWAGEITPYDNMNIDDLFKLLGMGDTFPITVNCECTSGNRTLSDTTETRNVGFGEFLEIVHNGSDFILVLNSGKVLSIWVDYDLGFKKFDNIDEYLDEYSLDFEELDELTPTQVPTQQNGLYQEFKKRIPEMEKLYYIQI